METIGAGPDSSKRLHICVSQSGLIFLIDTGAEISIIPVSDKRRQQLSDLKLYAANGTSIDTFGEVRLVLNLRLRRPLAWNFYVVAVPYPIIGADLLDHHGLIVDLRRKCLIDSSTNLSSVGSVKSSPNLGISPLDRFSRYSAILADFPKITGLKQAEPIARHEVFHHITTQGPPLPSGLDVSPPTN